MRAILTAYLLSLSVLAALAIGGGAILLHESAPSNGAEAAADRHSFNLFAWELRHLPEKWLYKVGDLVSDHSQGLDADQSVVRYFTLVDEIRNLERTDPNSPRLAAAESVRADLENTVEDIIEGRVTSVLKDEGLTIGPPPFTDMQTIFPPVDFELDTPPRVLVISPRERISRDDGYLLTPGLTRDTVTGIEQGVESRDGVSALVVQAGGVATYPSVISSSRDYAGLVDTVFHEWLHQYLIMFPLGRSYFNGGEAQTLNESVANIAGRELAAVYLERYGDPTQDPGEEPSPTPAPSDFDFRAEMRALRLEVEDLLNAGNIEDAETLMNRKRDEFEDQGVFIRRINQAYFAFFGSYADTPASIDPIGPKLEALYKDSGSPGEFVRRAYGITSTPDLDQALARSD